ncbi:hypothetical protein JTE90_018053 [Oedothorax gibbosus]|uniref:Uncharacterized protein n=1 Tax=Oedothorax gibbosus TaxID=931172 RepID=A0AAV6TDZ4_9ARAC|nr:hypothetical protein JTE90_018053 [Oedothorax gibbosus]
MADNCNRAQSPARKRFNGLPIPVVKGKHTMSLHLGTRVAQASKALQTCYCLCLVRLKRRQFPLRRNAGLGMIRAVSLVGLDASSLSE